MDEMEEVIQDFLVESYEGLDQLDLDLVELEKTPTDADRLAAIFRCIHTIKGTCGFLGFTKLEALTHVGENLLSRLRDGELTLDAELTSGLLAMVDAVRAILGHIEASRHEGQADYTQLVATLEALENGGAQPAAVSLAVEDGPHDVAVEVNAPVAGDDHGGVTQSDAKHGRHQTAMQPARGASEAATNVPNEAEANSSANRSESSLRVPVGQLDKLMNLVGELVLARNQILQHTATQDDPGFVATSQQLNHITTELQEGIMKTRMQPIGNIWTKFPRVVRDLAKQFGKQIRIEMNGKETELDKTILEAIKDPLTHIVRNSADHGIETPEERVANGKPAEGRLFLRAYHEGGQVNIEVSDDGAGIDPEKIKAKAIEKGVISTGQASALSDREAVNLVFHPGFSTAEQVTNVSGRGVGMDVVRTNIEKIGGTVDLQSRPGKGTTLKVKIPLTLAIIPALIVRTGNERYAIPQVSLLELVRLEGEQARVGIELIHGAPVYRLRGKLLPLAYLNKELNLEPIDTNSADQVLNIVVLHADEQPFGLVVDQILDTEEIVVKPLSKQLKGIQAFAGATVMGDGAVALILDVLGLAQNAHVVTERRDQAPTGEHRDDEDARGTRQTLLIVSLGAKDRLAVPLSQVARLEEFSASSIEMAGRRQVVQYRGEIMPLISLADVLDYDQDNDSADTLHVVVHSRNGCSVGLVVHRILDIVDEVISVQRETHVEGLIGSVVVRNQVTDLLDIDAIINKHEPSMSVQTVAA